jgi:6-phosphogluconolactonase
MRTIIAQKEEIDRQAAGVIEDAIGRLLEYQDYVVLAVLGGTSVSGIFEQLKSRKIPWQRVHVFMVDERLVPLDNPESNYRQVYDTLLSELITRDELPEGNVHPFVLDKKRQDNGVSAYEEELKNHGGRYDVVLLRSGEDGHIGALYPNHHSVEDDAEYFITMNDSPKPPPNRMTMSRKLLLRSQVAILLFLGEGKREALNKFRDDRLDCRAVPSRLVQQVKEAYVFTDLREQDD